MKTILTIIQMKKETIKKTAKQFIILWFVLFVLFFHYLNYYNEKGRYNPKLFPAEHFNKNIKLQSNWSDTIIFKYKPTGISTADNNNVIGLLNISDTCNFIASKERIYSDTTYSPIWFYDKPYITSRIVLKTIDRQKPVLKSIDTVLTKCDTLVILRYE